MLDWFKNMIAKNSPVPLGGELEMRGFFENLYAEAVRASKDDWAVASPKSLQSWQPIEEKSKEFRRQMALWTTKNVQNVDDWRKTEFSWKVVNILVRQPLDWSSAEFCQILLASLSKHKWVVFEWHAPLLLIGLIEKMGELAEPSRNLIERILAKKADVFSTTTENAKIEWRLKRLLETSKTGFLGFIFNEDDHFGAGANEFFQNMPPAERAIAVELFQLFQSSNSTKPSAKWLKTVASLFEKMGEEQSEILIENLLERVRTTRLKMTSQNYPELPDLVSFLAPPNAVFVKGLVWSVAAFSEAKRADFAPILGDLAEFCFRKISGQGLLAASVGNACAWSLGELGAAGLGQLGRLKAASKNKSAQRIVEKTWPSSPKKKASRGPTLTIWRLKSLG